MDKNMACTGLVTVGIRETSAGGSPALVFLASLLCFAATVPYQHADSPHCFHAFVGVLIGRICLNIKTCYLLTLELSQLFNKVVKL